MPISPDQNSAVGQPKEKGQVNFEESACRERILNSLDKAGFKEKISPELMDRLVLLEQGSDTNKDSRQIETALNNVLNYLKDRYSKDRPEFNFTPKQISDARVAALLHDMGKSGPKTANQEQQRAVIRVFALDNVNGVDRPIRKVIAECFPEEGMADKLLASLPDCVDPDMPLSYLHNRHAYWTYDILEDYLKETYPKILAIASSHHINKGIDPYNKQDNPVSPDAIKIQGDATDNLSAKALLVIDKYQAAIRRGPVKHLEALAKHEYAIKLLSEDLKKFEQDESLGMVIKAVDELGKQGKIFA